MCLEEGLLVAPVDIKKRRSLFLVTLSGGVLNVDLYSS